MSSQDRLLIIGIMSGTSLDGIDVALASICDKHIDTLHTQFSPFDSSLKNKLAEAASTPQWQPDDYHQTEHQLTIAYANAVNSLLEQAGLKPSGITALACHGQTVRHKPELQTPYTVQMVNGALLTEETGITVITDFRARDIAAGGEGAPLAPGFHYHFFSATQPKACVVNIGGFANLTYWDDKGNISGYDTGPGNVLLDAWVQREFNESFDKDGKYCRTGYINQSLLASMLKEPYFKRPAPKSTGREYFHMDWLNQQLSGHQNVSSTDVLTTLAELTCVTIADEIVKHPIETVLVCGGGTNNSYLMERLQTLLPNSLVTSTQTGGIDPNFVEAIAFAWFGYQTLNRQTSNCPGVTGAAGPRILGAIYPK